MWALYGWLLAKGQIAYANAKIPDQDFIAIYPEIYQGNQAGASTVVRYILNKPGELCLYGTPGPTKFDKSDHIFVFSKIFDTLGVDEDHLMFLPVLNLHLFTNQGKKRKRKCVFIGKGQDLKIHPDNCISIDRKFAKDQKALADLLNECEVMYGYDPVSAMYEVARLCGCRVVILSNSRTNLKDYEPGLNGISFDLEDKRLLDTERFRKHYISMIKLFDKKIDRFITITQQ